MSVVPFERPEPMAPVELVQEYTSSRGLKPETLDAARVRVCATMDELFKVLGDNRAVWPAKKAGFTCALYFPANGDPESRIYRARLLRSDKPELLTPIADAAAFKGKYLGMTRALNALFQLPSGILPHNSEPHDLMLVEGSFNAMRLGQDGIDAIAVSGINNFTVSDQKTSPVIPELLTRVAAANTKRLIIAWDSDQRHNMHTQVGINKLAMQLMKVRKDHEIYVAYPPNADDGSKWGWDDFLQAKGRAAFDEWLRRPEELKRWDDNPFIRKCIEWQRYVSVISTGKMFDTHPHVFAEVDKSTADMAMMQDSQMLDPMSNRAQLIWFNHKHYLNSPYALKATMGDMMPEHEQVLVHDVGRSITVVNTYRYDLLAEPKKGDISWWLELINGLCKDTPSAIDKMIKLAAYKVQYPTRHLPLALGIIGDQGAGKSLFAKSIGVCVGNFSDCKVSMKDTDNSTWAGYLVREWMEIASDMDVETWKMLVRQSTQIVRNLYANPKTINARTLHIITNNHIRQLVSKGDRVMIFAGQGKRISNELGLRYHKLIGEPNRPGPGIAALRYHLMYEIDADDAPQMDNRTELLGEIIEASQTRQEDVVDELLFAISDIPGLEILPSTLVNTLLEQLGFRGSFMSLRKLSTSIGTPLLKEGVKIGGLKVRFCVLKNLEKWKQEADPQEYRKQFDLADPLFNSKPPKY